MVKINRWINCDQHVQRIWSARSEESRCFTSIIMDHSEVTLLRTVVNHVTSERKRRRTYSLLSLKTPSQSISFTIRLVSLWTGESWSFETSDGPKTTRREVWQRSGYRPKKTLVHVLVHVWVESLPSFNRTVLFPISIISMGRHFLTSERKF